MINREKYNKKTKKDLLNRLGQDVEEPVGEDVSESEMSGVGDAVEPVPVEKPKTANTTWRDSIAVEPVINSDIRSGTKEEDEGDMSEFSVSESESSKPDSPDSQSGPKNGKSLRFAVLGAIFVVIAVILGYHLITSLRSDARYIGTLVNASSEASWEDPIGVDPVKRCQKIENANSVPEITAKAYVVVFPDTFDVVAEKNADQKVAFASITKLLGAIVVLESGEYDLDSRVGLLEEVDVEGNGVELEVGETATVEDLLGAALIGSKNDAMYALAQNYPGGEAAFVAEMNVVAQDLGLENTSISNPVGLDALDHFSSPRDIAVLSAVAMKNPAIAELVAMPGYSFQTSNGRDETVWSTNLLIGEVDGVVGVKTGYTEDSGLCLVSYVDDEKDFITVVMNAEDRVEESRQLIEWVRSSYLCE